VISGYLTQANGRWIARLLYTEGGKRRERKRTLGRAHQGRGRPKAGTIPRKVALDLLADARRELEAELARAHERETRRTDGTLRAIALAWLDDAGRAGGRPWKPSTARGYRSILGQSRAAGEGHIMGPLGSLGLGELTEERMRAWWASLSELSPQTANKNLSVLRGIFAWADRDGRWGRIGDPTRTLRRRPLHPPVNEPRPPPPAPARRRAPPVRRPGALRPRERATLVVIILGVPLLVFFATMRILPDVLWFDELGRVGVFTRIQAARVELFLLAGGAAAVALWANLAVGLPRAGLPRTRPVTAIAAAASLITASYFASSASGHWQSFLLWWHRQSFGVNDPMHGKDVGYFVFSLPFERAVSGFLLWLVAVAAVYAALAYRAGGAITLRPRHASGAARVHLATLAAIFLLVVAWRLRLERYTLELGQPSRLGSGSFAGAGYVDTHVRSPLLAAGSLVAVVLALACLAAPRYARRNRRRARLLVAVPAGLALVLAVAGAVASPLVQRFIVEPSQLSRERPFLSRSIAATRAALGLDAIDVRAYAPTGRLSPTEITRARNRFADLQVWDSSLLEARARQLVTSTPYYNPEQPTFDISRVGGRREPTIASARELDLRPVRRAARSWGNERLAYTHGLGQIRFSATDVVANRQPQLLDAGLGIREPRIYFGDLPQARTARRQQRLSKVFTAARGNRPVDSPWVVANTRTPEVDVPASYGAPRSAYHYDGTGGIAVSDVIRRVAFALDLRSKALLLSHSITPDSRILLHRDVEDRLQTLAPFIQWDAHPAALAESGRIVFVVDGYTTSSDYPYAQRVDLGGADVNYARASVRARVDAFSGKVNLYLTDRSDPIARAWAAAFPGLLRPEEEMPPDLRGRLRYPRELFAAQATAYQRFHTTGVDQFASGADVWSRPIALAGSIEVAGNVDFDQSDEDDLRLTMRPAYRFSPPPGRHRARLLLETYYSPRRAQNLVATLSGWVDAHGRARLASRSLASDPVTLGPAQVSRQVFATPRVSNLLGLSNLELRDLGRSSLDSVVLGQPQLLFLHGGPIQIQSLYEGSRGPAAARLIGVTAFINGRAGLGPDIEGAVRQALHKPPTVTVVRPRRPIVVGRPVELRLVGKNARSAVVTITSSEGSERASVAIGSGGGRFRWVPTAAGSARVRVEARGLDGSRATARTALHVLRRPPAIRLTRAPRRAVVGRPVRAVFKARHSVGAVAEVASAGGIEFTRRYVIHDGTGFVEWTPRTPGRAVLSVRADGHDGQAARDSVRVTVARAPPVAPPPTVTLLETPHVAIVGRPSEIVFRAGGCREAVARIDAGGERERVWRFRCAVRPIRLVWSPTRPGTHLLTVSARGSRGTTSQATAPLRAERRR
jgi:uncharacterized protein